ncbi:MAG: phosphodiester glycosidase family protein [Myxococcales bacterium]|nr:phosphodiester glycosidase family protein [Myxococcales bacterium]
MPHPRTTEMLARLRAEPVNTWFELGLLIDRLREDRDVAVVRAAGDFEHFKRELSHAIAFLTFEYGIDGVSMEIAKYARALQTVLPGAKFHYIGGSFTEQADNVIDVNGRRHTVEGMKAFGEWPLYQDFFERKLERGGPLYNELIQRFWDATLQLCRSLGEIVEEHEIRLLYLVNVNSNPGNPALALATIFVSELLGVPVINNCHDFFFEGGHSAVDRQVGKLPSGPRDHFFTNAHVGEVFSILEMIYPWDSRSWLSLCINTHQTRLLCEQIGLNPAGVAEIGTAIDTERYAPLGRRRSRETWDQLVEILKGRRSRVRAVAAEQVVEAGSLKPGHPILIARNKQVQVDFASNNTMFLQPTRILARKSIGSNFKLIARLLRDREFAAAFRADPSKKLTLLVTGPVAAGNEAYLESVVREFAAMVSTLDSTVRDRVYLALLFSAFDTRAFRAAHERPIGMPEFYNIASLVVLPSETEGRGLPIIESAACGVPILTRRYEPQDVFSAVVGENLARNDRLDVNAFSGSGFVDTTINRLRNQLLSREGAEKTAKHNRQVVERRFSMRALASEFEVILKNLHFQLQPGASAEKRAASALERFADRVSGTSAELSRLLAADHREYLPGYGRMGFMLLLKSLIDPSYFRVEEQRLRGMAFAFARRLVATSPEPAGRLELAEFYNAVEELFLRCEAEMPVRIDHSFAYRHRNRRHYPYRDLTPQELTGVIALLHCELFGPAMPSPVDEASSLPLADWHGMVAQGCGSEPEIDDRDRLLERVRERVPLALFPGAATEHELEVFVVQTARLRLGLGLFDELSGRPLSQIDALPPIFLIVRRDASPGEVTAEALEKYLVGGSQSEVSADRDLKLLHQRGVCRVVASDQISVGVDFRQLGEEALRTLDGVREAGGFAVVCCEHGAMTTDGAAIERFHIGRTNDLLTANLLGVSLGSGYVQWAPAGLRCTLAYPTPVQTAKSLSKTLADRRFRRLCKRLGTEFVLEALRADAVERGSPVEDVLDRLSSPQESRPRPVVHESLNGVYADGSPWSGVIASVPSSRSPLRYAIVTTKGENRTVPEFVRRFNRSPGKRARIAWNGGYILNAELVGKLGLPESYIGSPLGLIISGGRVLSPPLFNKPAFLVGADGSLCIRRVSCEAGLCAQSGRSRVELAAEQRNLSEPGQQVCFYDLLYPGASLPGDGRSLVRLVGNRIMEVHHTLPGQDLPVLPVGLVVSFPSGGLPSDWEVGRVLSLDLAGISDVADAIEAGPLLLDQGELCIDMEIEGWKTQNSIQTQAARLDYLDMRGPKIAVGLDAEGGLGVLAVNGRIRESVGATHGEMAEILRARGIQSAMGFDPGGSATLVVGEEPLNISPYNRDYERNVYSLPPQPRGVANAVVGY